MGAEGLMARPGVGPKYDLDPTLLIPSVCGLGSPPPALEKPRGSFLQEATAQQGEAQGPLRPARLQVALPEWTMVCMGQRQEEPWLGVAELMWGLQ